MWYLSDFRENQRKMKKHPGSRLSQFDAIDRPALKPLPTQPYSYTLVKQVSVHIDYHVEIENIFRLNHRF